MTGRDVICDLVGIMRTQPSGEHVGFLLLFYLRVTYVTNNIQ